MTLLADATVKIRTTGEYMKSQHAIAPQQKNIPEQVNPKEFLTEIIKIRNSHSASPTCCDAFGGGGCHCKD